AAASLVARGHGEQAEVLALRLVEQQRVGEGVDDGQRGVGVAALFQPGQVVRTHPGPDGDLLAAQAGGAATTDIGQPHVGGAQLGAAGDEEFGEPVGAHIPIMADPGTAGLALSGPGKPRPWYPPRPGPGSKP